LVALPRAIRSHSLTSVSGLAPRSASTIAPDHRAQPAAPARPLARLASFAGRDSLLGVAVIALAAGLLLYLPSAFGVDSWLALLAGREIWQHGLPQQETLTIFAHGVRWVDQQWLAELSTYALDRAGGLALVGLVNVALIAGAVAIALATARSLGAQSRSVLICMPACVWLLLPAREVRTQEFALPLFALVVHLLATDSRRPSRRVYLCLPILIVWGNLHGTVSVGAGLVALRGITLAWERRLQAGAPRRWLRPAALIAGAPLCALLTPYGGSIATYYDHTLLNSALRHAVTEWQPITSSMPVAIPFLALAGALLWSFGRQPAASTLWERLALLALALLSVEVIRNVELFGLCALALAPVAIERLLPPGRPARNRPAINALIALSAAAFLLATVAATLARSPRSLGPGYQRSGLLAAVRSATAADPRLRVFTDSRFADWLLWADPALAGRVAYDIRYELLSASQLREIQLALAAIGPHFARAAQGYRLLVLARNADRFSVAAFLAERGRRVLYEDADTIVILRPAWAQDHG
jgi:hypothetical protein